MASLGFRHPQFSEDLAWLPAWLQRHQVEASEEYQTTASQAIKDLEILQGNINEVNDGELLSGEESRYKSCHLFFSGEDFSPASFAPSSEKVFNFHLHLSSCGASLYTESEFLYGSQACCDSKKFLSMQQAENSRGTGQKTNVNKVLSTLEVETSAASGKKINSSKVIPMQEAEIFASSGSKSCQLKLTNSVGGVNLSAPTSFPKATENLGVQSPISHYDIGMQCEENWNVRYLKDVDTIDAVELSISASEALVIHELLKNESAPETLPNAAVLEATLRVKQARSERKENAFNYTNKEIDETDSLLDLDDFSMADACEDVGLSFTGPNEKLVCSSDACLVKDTFFSENKCECDDGFKHVDFLAYQKKFPVDQASGSNKPHFASKDDLLSHQSAKEIVAPAQLDQNNRKNFQNFFVNETSFLSESADGVRDENSFLHKHETGSKRASQASVPFEGSSNKPDERILNSQNVSSSVLSLVDPLCSFVPCSVSTMNTSSPQLQNQNDIEVDAQKWLHEAETLQRTPCLKFESVNGGRQDVPMVAVDGFEAPIRRQLTSLKTYSSLLAEHNPKLDKGRLCHNRFFPSECVAEIISLEQKMGCINAPDKKCSEYYLDDTDLEKGVIQETIIKVQERSHFQNTQLEFNNPLDTQVPTRKRVHFSEIKLKIQENKDVQHFQTSHDIHSTARASKRSKYSNTWLVSRTEDMKRYFGTGRKNRKRLILQGFQFLLTGLPRRKEKEIEELIRENGGMVLPDIPSPNSIEKRRQKSNFQQLLIVLCLKTLKTSKFLYGCAVKALILKVKWLTDSIAAGSVVLPEKYMIISTKAAGEIIGRPKTVHHGIHKFIFERVGIMLHGKRSFCTKFATIFKHGGGQVFKSLQWLVQSLQSKNIFVGCIVAEDERRTSRHLRQFASERKIPMVPSSWLIKSLHLGKLLPLTQEKCILHCPLFESLQFPPVDEMKRFEI